MATIYDVAKAAGVSPKTVSRVMNGDGPVSPATRSSVRKAMSVLGYVPSSAARSIKSRKSGLVGLITGAISLNPATSRPAGLPDIFIVQGIQEVMGKSRATLLIADTGGDADQVPALARTFEEHRVEGLIYVTDHHQEVVLPPIAPSTKVVLVNCFDRQGTPCILPDDRQGQFDLVSRLTAEGHERIGFLTLPADLVAARLRHEGYVLALVEADLDYDPNLVIPIDTADPDAEPELLRAAIYRLMALPEPPSVICCGNDRLAVVLYGVLREMGISIPDELSIAGYDNYQSLAETLYPTLTTVELPYRAMGVAAANALLSGDAPSSPSLIQGAVFWRQSVKSFYAEKSIGRMK